MERSTPSFWSGTGLTGCPCGLWFKDKAGWADHAGSCPKAAECPVSDRVAMLVVHDPGVVFVYGVPKP